MHIVNKSGIVAGSVGALLIGSIGVQSAPAALIGSSVSGVFQVNSVPPNYFDPANGFVPATGYENSSSQFNSATVPISATASEYGYADTANTIIADFGSNTLLLSDISNSGALPLHFTFTDAQFANYSIIKSNDTFPGGVTYSLVGTTLTIDTGNYLGSSGFFNAQFVMTAIPEPVTGGLMLLPFAVLGRRRR